MRIIIVNWFTDPISDLWWTNASFARNIHMSFIMFLQSKWQLKRKQFSVGGEICSVEKYFSPTQWCNLWNSISIELFNKKTWRHSKKIHAVINECLQCSVLMCNHTTVHNDKKCALIHINDFFLMSLYTSFDPI
jgi:hypothetical protein